MTSITSTAKITEKANEVKLESCGQYYHFACFIANPDAAVSFNSKLASTVNSETLYCTVTEQDGTRSSANKDQNPEPQALITSSQVP